MRDIYWPYKKNYLPHRWPFNIHQNLTSFASEDTYWSLCDIDENFISSCFTKNWKKCSHISTKDRNEQKFHSILPIFAMISDGHTIKFILALMTAIKIDQFSNEENVAIFFFGELNKNVSMKSKLTLMDVIDDLLMDFSFIMIIFCYFLFKKWKKKL